MMEDPGLGRGRYGVCKFSSVRCPGYTRGHVTVFSMPFKCDINIWMYLVFPPNTGTHIH